MKLIFETPPAEVWKDPRADPTEDIKRLKEEWEYEVDDLITIQMPESCVKIEFEGQLKVQLHVLLWQQARLHDQAQ